MLLRAGNSRDSTVVQGKRAIKKKIPLPGREGGPKYGDNDEVILKIWIRS
jgi:hypothetical protein